MRKGLPAAIAILIFLGLASPAYAIELRPNLQKVVSERVAKVASRTAEVRADMKARQQAKLSEFRDQKKAKAVEQISDSLNKINQRHVEQMTKHLARMTELLAKVEANSKTTAAQTAIQAAQTGVEAQKAKDYTINVSAEATVRDDAKKAREQLRTDIQATNELLKAAKQALIAAIREGAND